MATVAKQLAERERVPDRVRSARLETQLAATGFGAVALHLADDSFFQPAPGTTAADHLLSGLVPIAVFTAAALLYPRLRGGPRGWLAIALGVLGIVIGGVEAAYYGPKDGLSGDDYTGLVAAAGGLLLVGVGAAAVWRSRRRDEPLVRRYSRRGLIGLATAGVLFFVLFPLALSYGFTHVARTATRHGDLGAPYEHVAFDASDGLRLDGWFVPSESGATVIVYPGKKGTQEHARMLVRHGY